MRARYLCAMGLVLAGCGKTVNAPIVQKPLAAHAVDPWVLTCYDADEKEPALLWNGQIGLRFGRDGSAFGADGRRLPMFLIDGYSATGEQKITTFENPLPGPPAFPNNIPDLEQATGYSQLLNMRTGALVTSWTQRSGGVPVRFEHSVVLDPKKRLVAERWQVTTPFKRGAQSHLPITPVETLRRTGQPTVLIRTGQGEGVPDPHSSSDFVERTVEIGPASGTPLASGGPKESFDQVLAESKRIWAQRWKTDIEIDGPVEDQQAVRSFLFYLRSAIGPDSKMSVSPFGLSSQTYNGHVFWDADIWVFPALALIDPQASAAIPKYRLAKLGQAKQNYDRFFKINPATTTEWYPQGCMFPWESSVTGAETVPGPSKLEHHITGSVAFSVSQAAALGLVPEATAKALIAGANDFYEDQSVPGPDGREIQNVMSPDENHIGNNDLYTNLLAEWLSHNGSWPASGKTTYKLPQDSQGFLTYDGDPLRAYKQAAAVLSIYPLQYPPAEKQAKQMMERFGSKVIKSGPAMSDSVHALIWARLGDTDKAYATWQDSWKPFMTGPLNLFSEKRSKPESYFVTGAAGSLQTVLYGFLGIRIDSEHGSPNAWSKQLLGGRVLSVAPHLPKEWRSVKLKNFTILGRHYTLTATQGPNGGTARVTQGD